jgi:hypothetical protein
MAFDVRSDELFWRVYQDGVRVLSGRYRAVEDWLDLAENSKRLKNHSKLRTSVTSRNDRDLDALRARADFEKLVREAEARLKESAK